jgi:microcystin-dependent protein
MDYFIGTIMLLPYGFNPYGTMLCDGRTLNVAPYQALYSLLGQYYGGNGSTTFCIPNMLGQEPQPGLNYYIVYMGLYPTRD